MWIPLEANPDVWNKYKDKLGVSGSWTFTDVYGFDPELLSFIPRPVIAVILLFPITPVYESFRKSEDLSESANAVSEKVWFTRQTVGNACGTVALLHAFANGISNSGDIAKDSPLDQFYKAVASFGPEDRAKYMETGSAAKLIAGLHQETSMQGQTAAPDAADDVDLHFVCFAEKDGCLYELDGRKTAPVNHGPCLSHQLLEESVRVAKEFMARDPDNLSFSAIALVQS